MTRAPIIATRSRAELWHNRSAEEVLTKLGSTTAGLSASEAAERLASDGPNELKEGIWISSLQSVLGQFKSRIVWILIAAGVISDLLGEGVDASAILTIVVLNAAIGCRSSTTGHSGGAFAFNAFFSLLSPIVLVVTMAVLR